MAGVTGVIPSDNDQATGLERKEVLAHLAGNTVCCISDHIPICSISFFSMYHACNII